MLQALLDCRISFLQICTVLIPRCTQKMPSNIQKMDHESGRPEYPDRKCLYKNIWANWQA